MSKTLAKAALIVGAVALVATGIGAAAGVGIGLGLSPTALATIATVGKIATIGAAALSVAAGATAKKPSAASTGSQTSFSADPDAGIPYLIGRTGTAGNIIARFGFDTKDAGDNDRQSFVAALSLGPVRSIEGMTVDKAATRFTGTGAAIGAFAGFMWSMTQAGAMPEAQALGFGAGAGNPPGWSAQHKLSGIAAATWTLRFDTKSKLYQNGVPAPMWTVQGALCYDPRKDSTFPGGSGPHRIADPSDTAAYDAAVATWEWSENPYLHGLKWAHGVWQRDRTTNSPWQRVMGMGAPLSGIDVAAFVEGANIADANGWKVGGVIYSGDGKWESLKKILQAGMGEPLALGARISCLVNAPRVSLATITIDDVIGEATVTATQPRRDRINTITPRYRLEANNWQLLPGAPISVAEYVTLDRGKRSKVQDYPFIQQTDQVGTAVRYDIENAREFGPIVLPLKLFWMGYKPGDCVTADLPELGLNAQAILLLNRDLDPAAGTVTMTARSETGAKHGFALGQTATPPPTPGVTGPALVPVPGPDAWTISGNSLASEDATLPALVITGAIDAGIAEQVIFEYRPFVDGQSTDEAWRGASSEQPAVTRKEITAVTTGTAYEAAVSYLVRGVVGNRRILGPVMTAGLITKQATDAAQTAEWPKIADPNGTKPENNATVGATIGGNLKDAAGNIVTGPQILNSALSLAPDGTLSVDLGNGPVPLGKVKLADIGGATETDRRRLTADLERIAAAVATLGTGQQIVMNVFRDAGMYADPASGQIKLFAIEQRAEQLAKLSVSLDAALGQIGLKASVDYVDRAITQAQLPGQAAALDSIYVRLTSAETNIDGLRASVQLKADATIVTGLSGTMSAVQQSLDALTATVALKASQTQVDQQGVRLSFAEQTLSALDGASITQAVSASRRIPADSDKAGEASILDMLNGARNLDTYQLGIALARTELGARVTDANTAIASLATQLAVQIGAVTAQYASEVAARISGDQATVSDLTAFKAQTSANVASINQALAAQTDATSAVAGRVDLLSTTVGGHTNTLRTYGESINGLRASYGVEYTQDGVITGFFRLDGSGSRFDATFLVNTFRITTKGTGGAIVTPFRVGDDGKVYMTDVVVTNLAADSVSTKHIVVGGVGFDQLQLGSAGQTLSYELQNDVTIARGGSTEVMWINITKLDADSEIEVQWSADVSSQDDVQFFAMFQVDGQTAKTRPLNEKYAKSNARTSTCPIVRLKGVAAGPRRIGITFSNQETDNASMTVYAGTLLKVTEIRKALLGMATGGEASGSSGSAGTGSGSGGGGTYNGGVAKFQTEQ